MKTSLHSLPVLILVVLLGTATVRAEDQQNPTHEVQAYIPATEPNRSEVIHCLQSLCHQKEASLVFTQSCIIPMKMACPQVLLKNLTRKTSQLFVGWDDSVRTELASALNKSQPLTLITGDLP